LGAEIATLLAKRGAQALVICGRNQANGLAQAQKITHETDVPVHFVQADLANVEDCRRVVAETDSRFGKIDILINAAGLTDRGNILDTSPELFDKLFAVNVRAPFFLMQEVVKVMRRQSIEGCIVNIGSMSAMAGQPFLAAYCASKGALATLTKNTAYALLRNRIRVNGLNIGWMASDGEDRIQRDFHHADDDWLAKAAAQQPFGRLISPQEVARSVAYLCSEESGLMTGSIIEFDQSVWGAYDGSPHPVAPL
jgi:NAD(P)-dependent dehydrogenase (short-subunit alcohol dehydrogenase family)